MSTLINAKFLQALAPADYGTLLPIIDLVDKTFKFKFLRNVPEGLDLKVETDIDDELLKKLKKITVIFEGENGLISFNIKSYLSFKGLPRGSALEILSAFRIKSAEPSNYFPNQSYTKYDGLWKDFIDDVRIIDKSLNNFYTTHPQLRDTLANTPTKDGAESYKTITIVTV